MKKTAGKATKAAAKAERIKKTAKVTRATPKKGAVKTAVAKKSAAKTPSGGRGPAKKRSIAKRSAAAGSTRKKHGPRADLGAPIDGFFAKQPTGLRAILEKLRRMVFEAAPDAVSSLKWGMPFFTIEGQTFCALAGFKSHVNLILAGEPGTFADPDHLLEGDGKTGRHLKLRALSELPEGAVRAWLKTGARRARSLA